MKKLLSFFVPMLMGLTFFASEANASHAQGSDLTYVNVGPNMYLVEFNFYRDCSGISASTTQTLTYRASGCHPGSTTTLTSSSVRIGNQYCPQITPTCNSSSPYSNYEEHRYSGLVTLPANCDNWVLSVRIGNRNNSRNLQNGANEFFYSETLLNNQDFASNNSPKFTNLPVPYVGVNLAYTYSLGVTEVDGDSLTYSLMPALDEVNTPVSYASGFSASNPFGPNANPGLTLDPATGSMSFKPTVIDSTSAPSQGMNKYVMVVQIDEFRKDTLSGMFKKIGHVRRDVLVTVIDCGPNQLPLLLPMTANGNAKNYNTVIEVEAGQPLNLQIPTSDPNLTNTLTVSSNFADYFQNGTITSTGSASNPTSNISITPGLSDVREIPYYITVTVKDDACPVVGFQTQTIGLRVLSPGSLTGIKEDLAKKYKLPTLLNVGLNDRLQLHEELKGATVNIYNHTGGLVKSFKHYDNNWSANTVAAGLYIYSVEHRGLSQPITSKLLVVK